MISGSYVSGTVNSFSLVYLIICRIVNCFFFLCFRRAFYLENPILLAPPRKKTLNNRSTLVHTLRPAHTNNTHRPGSFNQFNNASGLLHRNLNKRTFTYDRHHQNASRFVILDFIISRRMECV